MKRIIIDTNIGANDSLAILYALRSPNFHVEGITTCFGNSNAGQSAGNCLRLIQPSDYGCEVPVAVGSNESLDGVLDSTPAHIHGGNGIGNVELPESSQKPVDETAQDFIIRKTGELKDELITITTGRMANLTRTLEKDPELSSKIKKVVVTDGILKEPGNVNPYAEANIHGDTKAAGQVFRARFNLALVGLDVIMKTFITDRDIRNLCIYYREECRAIADYIRDILKFYFEFHRISMGMAEACVVHDPLVVLIAEGPSLGVFRMVRVGVGYEHKPFRGMIKMDTGLVPVLGRGEIAMCMEVDFEKAVRGLFSLFQDMAPGRYNRKQEHQDGLT